MENEFNIEGYAEEVLTGEGKKETEAMTDDELISLIEREKNLVETDAWDVLSQQRINSTLQYEHTINGNLRATTGLSSVVYNFTAPAVETLTTYMTKVFCSDKETVVFNPTNPQMIQVADQASKLVNQVIHKYNSGYKIMSRMFKDAAINKNSIVKVTWDSSMESFEETYEDLQPGQLEAIMADKEAYGYECEIVEEAIVEETVVDEMSGVELSTSISSATIKCSMEVGMPKIDVLPPEEFMINEGATDINDSHLTRFVAHRRQMYLSDIMEMFPDVDESMLGGSTDDLSYNYEKQARHYFDGTDDQFDTDNGDENMRKYEFIEAWVKADRDGDGIAEWRHTMMSGKSLLMDEPWYGSIPFASFCYFNIPHKFWGLSVNDKLRDYERSATALLRSEVDSSVFRNTNRIIADPRFVNTRDLQTVNNGVIRALPGFDPKHVMPIQPATGGSNSQAMLEHIRQMVIGEIGIDPVSGQISTDVEKSGNDATKTSLVIDNASAKIEMYAREFADNTFRDVIWQVLMLLVSNANHPSVLSMVEAVTPGQPFHFAQIGMQAAIKKSDLTAKVGLGHMTGQQKVAATQSLLQLMTAFTQDPNQPLPVPPQAKLELAYEMARGWGYDNPEKLFGTMEEVLQGAQQAQQEKAIALQMQQQQMGMQQQQLQLQTQQVQSQMQLAAQDQQFKHNLQTAQHQADLITKQVQADETIAKTGKVEAETDKIDVETSVAESGVAQPTLSI